jgi:hypothetical protein
MQIRLLLFSLLFPCFLFAQKEKRKVFTTTPTYDEIISTYTSLVANSKIAKLSVAGATAVGKPLHVVVLSKDGKFDPPFSGRPDAVAAGTFNKALMPALNW